MRHNRTSPEQRNAKLEAAHQQLVDAVASVATSEGWLRYLAAMRRFHDYSPANVMMILIQRPDAQRVAGYRTWQGLRRQVNKGASGIAIWAPCQRRVELEDETTGDTVTAKRLSGFRLVHVFDVSDTVGDPIPEHPARARLLAGVAPEGMWSYLAAQIEPAGFHLELVDEIPGNAGANGVTDILTRTVRVATSGRSEASQARTLCHELAHVKLHGSSTVAGCRELKEVEAESVAYLVSHAFGLDAMEYSLGYVAAWSGADVDTVLATARTVQRCAAEILAGWEDDAERCVTGVRLGRPARLDLGQSPVGDGDDPDDDEQPGDGEAGLVDVEVGHEVPHSAMEVQLV